MATFVLVHGGGHGGWCYQPVARRLQAAGHVVYAPTLSGLGDRAHQLHAGIDLDTHVTDVVELLRFEDLRDVVLVGHSYGGMVITGAADRAGDRIGTLVYLDAAHPRNGQSLRDVAGAHMDLARGMGAVIDGIELVLLPGEGAAGFYGIEDPEVAAWADERLTAHPWRCFEQELVLQDEDAVRAIRRVKINCTESLLASGPTKRGVQTDGDVVLEIDTGHDLMLTEPDRVAEMLIASLP
ncbi:MAG: alpha/beta hydrolase [Actinobacteria bacterium]|nr:alpha/beta hydrolase [Actinomycetota bacterium]